MRPTTILSLCAAVVFGVLGLALAAWAFIDRAGGKPWFYWIAPLLVLGFGSVACSGFATLREFGLLSAWTLAVCILADLLLLPAVLVRWRL